MLNYAIIGSGLIGRCWAVMFARAQNNVFLYDSSPSALTDALCNIEQQLEQLAKYNLLYNQQPQDILKRITTVTKIVDLFSLNEIHHVQECIPEDLDLKIQLFTELDRLVKDTAILASSTSCLMPSAFTKNLQTRHRCIVAHPLNPPTGIPVVEIVGSEWTDKKYVDLAVERYKSLGMHPIRLKKEVDGFVMNRMQYAVLASALSLVEDGIIEPEDVDLAMTSGLACRWSFMGPFQTIDLNAPCGVKDYFARYGSTMKRVLADMSYPHDWSQSTVDKIDAHFRQKYPITNDSLQERKLWRDDRLLEITKHKSSYSDRSYRIVRHSLESVESYDSILKAIENELKQVYRQVQVNLIEPEQAKHLDFTQEPWNLASKGIGTNAVMCQLGGPKNVEKVNGHSVIFDLESVLSQIGHKEEQSFIFGPGAAYSQIFDCNAELALNTVVNSYNKIKNNHSYASIIQKQTQQQQQLPYCSEKIGPYLHMMVTNGAQSVPLIEIKVSQRYRVENGDSENNFISTIRRGLKELPSACVLGGVFRLEEGTIKAHVMPDFKHEDLLTREQVNSWLKFYEMKAPLICLSVVMSENMSKVGFHGEHTHFFSKHGHCGHYHYDITPDSVSYHGYFVPCIEAIQIDPV